MVVSSPRVAARPKVGGGAEGGKVAAVRRAGRSGRQARSTARGSSLRGQGGRERSPDSAAAFAASGKVPEKFTLGGPSRAKGANQPAALGEVAGVLDGT
eukprot:CAMPEP_0197494996 /NCGR_PEP_ID=MMETSP1311-20131121/33582_1 /TAXON_ID=464262 /ORGANISM="Genus nov. species nov., Strain RCC856" /LENGTH=98 /DNA_ID=CAMNT_0043040453 /DNA_START=115 /DNA_END=407 /DNA_ORIENTATION=-